MTLQRLVRDLREGLVLEVIRPRSRARVVSMYPAPDHLDAPEGSVVVNFRFLDGDRAGDLDGLVLSPLQRVRLSDG